MSDNKGPRQFLAMSAVFDVPRSLTGCADDKLLTGQVSKVIFKDLVGQARSNLARHLV